MNKNNIYMIIGLIMIFFLFLISFIYPLPSVLENLDESITLNELTKECSGFIGVITKSLDSNIRDLCSKYNKINYIFIFSGILCIFLIILTLYNQKQEVNVEN
jgi:hypothetical protein